MKLGFVSAILDGWSFEVLRAEGFRVTRVRAAKQPEMPVYADE